MRDGRVETGSTQAGVVELCRPSAQGSLVASVACLRSLYALSSRAHQVILLHKRSRGVVRRRFSSTAVRKRVVPYPSQIDGAAIRSEDGRSSGLQGRCEFSNSDVACSNCPRCRDGVAGREKSKTFDSIADSRKSASSHPIVGTALRPWLSAVQCCVPKTPARPHWRLRERRISVGESEGRLRRAGQGIPVTNIFLRSVHDWKRLPPKYKGISYDCPYSFFTSCITETFLP